MNRLPKTRKKNGCFYRLLCRSERVAMYEMSYTEGGPVMSYEVFLIKVAPACVLHGHAITEHERFPSNEEFGKSAWAYSTREFAQATFDRLSRRES
jgi:hypothetical protein